MPGGAGILGSVVANRLAKHGAGEIVVLRGSDYDLVKRDDLRRLLNDTRPDVILHLAANVGGIGAHRAHPAEFFQLRRSQGGRGGFGFYLGDGRLVLQAITPPKGNHTRLRHPQWVLETSDE